MNDKLDNIKDTSTNNNDKKVHSNGSFIAEFQKCGNRIRDPNSLVDGNCRSTL